MKPLKEILLGFLIFSSFFINCTNENTSSNTSGTDSINKTRIDSQKALAIDPQNGNKEIDNGDDPNVENDLINKIKQLQHQYVRDSWGTDASDCFTNNDLQSFRKNGVIQQIVTQLKNDNDFKTIVTSLKRKSLRDRMAILKKAEETYRKSWSFLKLDPQSVTREELLKGQTDTGSLAERSIAEAVVNLIK